MCVYVCVCVCVSVWVCTRTRVCMCTTARADTRALLGGFMMVCTGVAREVRGCMSYAHSHAPPHHTKQTPQALPVCAREGVTMAPRAPGHTLAPIVSMRRVWVRVVPLSPDGRLQLATAIQEWERWCREREASFDRFAVTDDRSMEQVKAESDVQKLLKKAYRSASPCPNPYPKP